jgi:hypothetical protein
VERGAWGVNVRQAAAGFVFPARLRRTAPDGSPRWVRFSRGGADDMSDRPPTTDHRPPLGSFFRAPPGGGRAGAPSHLSQPAHVPTGSFFSSEHTHAFSYQRLRWVRSSSRRTRRLACHAPLRSYPDPPMSHWVRFVGRGGSCWVRFSRDVGRRVPCRDPARSCPEPPVSHWVRFVGRGAAAVGFVFPGAARRPFGCEDPAQSYPVCPACHRVRFANRARPIRPGRTGTLGSFFPGATRWACPTAHRPLTTSHQRRLGLFFSGTSRDHLSPIPYVRAAPMPYVRAVYKVLTFFLTGQILRSRFTLHDSPHECPFSVGSSASSSSGGRFRVALNS